MKVSLCVENELCTPHIEDVLYILSLYRFPSLCYSLCVRGHPLLWPLKYSFIIKQIAQLVNILSLLEFLSLGNILCI